MRKYLVPIIPALTVLTLTTLGAAIVASSPDLSQTLTFELDLNDGDPYWLGLSDFGGGLPHDAA